MDNALATALERSLGFQRPQTTEHAVQLLEAFRPELERLRRIATAVEAVFGRSFANAKDAEAALVQMQSFHDAHPRARHSPRSRF